MTGRAEAGYASQIPTSTQPHLRELVSDSVFAYLQPRGGWCVSNAGVLVGEDTVTLIDCTATPASARHLRDEIAHGARRPVTRVVITHHHGDHHFGAGVFTGATVIAHEQTRAAILRDGVDLPAIWPDANWGEISLAPPDLTFTDRLTVHLGNQSVELVHYGPAHTAGDVVVWLPEARILFAGDLTFSGSTPFILMGSLAGSLRVLQQLRELQPRTVVSGHGPITGPEVIDHNAAYLRWVQQLAIDGIAAGWDPLETATRADLGPYRLLGEAERLVGNLHRAYAELAGPAWPQSPRIDRVLADMITFNGGRPLPCTL